MVVKIELTVKHIRGDSFQVDIDHEADALGLKVVIWEQQHISVPHQRLVFAGRELDDNTKLTDVGIDDGAVIFLVEANDQQPAANVAEVQVSADAPPAYGVAAAAPVQAQVVPAGVEAMGVQSYSPLDEDPDSEEKINAAIDLSYWVSFYAILAMIGTAAAGVAFGCPVMLGLFVVYLLGWLGARKLCACLLAFPLLVVVTGIAFGGGGVYVYHLLHAPHFQWRWMVPAGVFLVAHLMIALSILVLICRVKVLSRVQRVEAVRRIARRKCCC